MCCQGHLSIQIFFYCFSSSSILRLRRRRRRYDRRDGDQETLIGIENGLHVRLGLLDLDPSSTFCMLITSKPTLLAPHLRFLMNTTAVNYYLPFGALCHTMTLQEIPLLTETKTNYNKRLYTPSIILSISMLKYVYYHQPLFLLTRLKITFIPFYLVKALILQNG